MDEKPVNAPAEGDTWSKFKREFTCNPESCAAARYHYKVGYLVASSLSGLICGVIIASIVFIPWLVFLSKFCSIR